MLTSSLIFPGRGMVGIEDTRVITDKGGEQVMQFPKQITIV